MFGDNKVIVRTGPMGNIVAAGQQIEMFYKLIDRTDNSDVYTPDISTSGAV